MTVMEYKQWLQTKSFNVGYHHNVFDCEFKTIDPVWAPLSYFDEESFWQCDMIFSSSPAVDFLCYCLKS